MWGEAQKSAFFEIFFRVDSTLYSGAEKCFGLQIVVLKEKEKYVEKKLKKVVDFAKARCYNTTC